jgi:hypothetical protein
MDMAFACAHFIEHGCGPLCEPLPCSTHLNPAGALKDDKQLKCFGFHKCLWSRIAIFTRFRAGAVLFLTQGDKYGQRDYG